MKAKEKYRISKVVKQFRTDQKRFLTSQVAGGAFNTLMAGALMTGFLLYLEIPVYYTGILMSIPMLANVVQILIDHIWDYFPQSGRMIVWMVFSARCMILAIVFIPVVSQIAPIQVFDKTTWKILLAAAIWFPAYILAAGSGIRLNYWMVSTFPAEHVSALLAYRDRIVIGISAGLSFAAGYYIDSLEGTKYTFAGYILVFVAAGAVSVLDLLLLKDVEYTQEAGKKDNRSFLKSLKGIRRDRPFLMFEGYNLLLNFAVNVANPYYNAYMIDRLHLKYKTIMLLTILLAVVQMAAAEIWGKLGAESAWWRILRSMTIVLGLQFIAWSFVTEKSIGLIILIYITSGLIATGLSAAQFMLPYRYVSTENVLPYMSLHTAVVALGGFAGSAVGSVIIRTWEEIEFYILGIPFTSMQVNMMVSGILILMTERYAAWLSL